MWNAYAEKVLDGVFKLDLQVSRRGLTRLMLGVRSPHLRVELRVAIASEGFTGFGDGSVHVYDPGVDVQRLQASGQQQGHNNIVWLRCGAEI